MMLVYAFDANPTKLIQLYIVGVFVSFTLSQTGMVRHWNRLLRDPTADTRGMQRKRAINFFAGVTTGARAVVVLVFKFTHGAWIAVVAMAVFWFVMRGIKGHYDAVSLRAAARRTSSMPLPSRNHAIVLVSKIHNPTLRALAYAKATRPHDLTALTVAVDEAEARSLQDEWDASGPRRAADGRRPRRTARSPGRSSTTCAASGSSRPATS